MVRRSMVSDPMNELPDWIKGDWCDPAVAEQEMDVDQPRTLEEVDDRLLRLRWVTALLAGDLKAAHRAWGKWQGFTGRDPWEDRGWSNFFELQRFGERLWDDFDAARLHERVLLNTLISCWPDAGSP